MNRCKTCSKWNKLGSLKEPRCRFQGLNVFNDNMYVMGGVGPNKKVKDSVEWYNYNKNEWEVIGKLEVKLADFCACVISHKSLIVTNFMVCH